MYDLDFGVFLVSQDVIFCEHEFPYLCNTDARDSTIEVCGHEHEDDDMEVTRSHVSQHDATACESIEVRGYNGCGKY